MFGLHKYLPNRHNPFQPPSWRWLRCQHLLALGSEPLRAIDDAPTRAAWRFWRELCLCRDEAARQRLTERHPVIAAAYRVYTQAEPLKRAELEARLLAKEDDITIAQKCSQTSAVVDAYHDLFYAVRPCLHAVFYIVHVAIGPRAHRQLTFADKDILLKLLGYSMGGLLIDKLLDYFADPPNDSADLSQLDDRTLKGLRDKFHLHALLLSKMLPADSIPSDRLAELRHLLEQTGCTGKYVSSGDKNLLAPIHVALDYLEMVFQSEATFVHADFPTRSTTAGSVRDRVGASRFVPDPPCVVPA